MNCHTVDVRVYTEAAGWAPELPVDRRISLRPGVQRPTRGVHPDSLVPGLRRGRQVARQKARRGRSSVLLPLGTFVSNGVFGEKF